MTMLVGSAVALGVAYACVAPWFYCNANTPEEDSQPGGNKQESDIDVSLDNQTLTSTHIRITGLRGLNFVSVTVPNQPPVSGKRRHSVRVHANSRTSIQSLNSNEISVEDRRIAHEDDKTKALSIPRICVSSVSNDTTVYPMSSNTSMNLLSGEKSSRIQRRISMNYSRGDAIRSHNVNDKDCGIRQMSGEKIHKPSRAHSTNSRLSENFGIANRNSLSSLNVHDKSLFDEIQRHSLYPNVNTIVGRNRSSEIFPSSTIIHKRPKNIVENEDLISEYTDNSSKIVESQYSLDKNSLCVNENLEKIPVSSPNKSILTKFFAKKCKKFWINLNKNNCDDKITSKSPVESIVKNNPMGHSTFIENSDICSQVQGHMNQIKFKSKMGQGHCGHHFNKHLKNESDKSKNMILEGITCCPASNLHETERALNTPKTIPNIPSQLEIQSQSNHYFSSSSTQFECNDDKPLDLSTKSKIYQTNINIKKYDNNNCTSKSTFMMLFKKQKNLILSKTFNKKYRIKKKCRSLPERDEMSIIKSISNICYRSSHDEDEKIKMHSDDSTRYPELIPINHEKRVYSTSFLNN